MLLPLPNARAAATDTNSLRPWDDYRSIMWISDSAYRDPSRVPLFFQRLREMGINTAMVHGDGDLQPLLTNAFPYYVENMVNRGLCLKFHSKTKDWDAFVTDWVKAGRPSSAFVREYCLDGDEWRAWARREVQSLVRKNAPHAPIAYDLRDELSVTMSANPFDFDFSPVALASFRAWLNTQYAGLEALNAQWETQFASWNDVKPFSTDEIKNRMASSEAIPHGQPDWYALQRLNFDPTTARASATRWNFSPWADFRTYMDLSLTRAVGDLRQAAREIDPRTPVGIEGTQMPSAWGGYDLWRLSRVLDWVEPYDIGNAREIFGSFMPGKPILTTVFEKDTDHARRRLWHLLLEGDRGCIIWWSEDCIDWKSADYAFTPKARALVPVLKEMTSPLARLFLRAEREFDPIAIHYSQASIQVDWLIESTRDGSTWHRRFSSHEASHNRMAKVRNSWLKAFQDLGYSPRFMSSEQIEQGELARSGVRVFVMPQSLALSDGEAKQIVAFASQTGDGLKRAFADGAAGLFDAHGKLRAKNALGDMFPSASSAAVSHVVSAPGATKSKPGDVSLYAAERLRPEPRLDWAEWIASHLGFDADVKVPVASRVRVRRYKLGDARLVAFERNVDYHMSEDLKQAGGNEALEQPVEFEARLREAAHVYDLRAQRYVGRTDRIAVQLDPWQPALFALLDRHVPPDELFQALSSGR